MEYLLLKFLLSTLVILKQQSSSLLNSVCSSDQNCTCSLDSYGYKADCSSLSLEIIPTFYQNVTDINLSNNNFNNANANQELPKRLLKLDLSSSNIHSIEEGFLRQFAELEYLDISYNRELTLDVLQNVTYDLQFTSIKVFKFEAIQCTFGRGVTLKLEHMYFLRNTSLNEIDFSSNRIEEIDQFVVFNLPKTIQKLTASYNRFKFGWYALELSSHPNIEIVNISNQHQSVDNYLSFFEEIKCNDSRKVPEHTRHPFNLTYPGQESNGSKLNSSCLEEHHSPPRYEFIAYVCLPPSLKTLIISHTPSFYSAKFWYYTEYDFTSIKTLERSESFVERLGQRIVSSNFTTANYSNNFLTFIEPTFFHRANLTVLDLSSNYLGNQIRRKNSSNILHGQIYLWYLSLSKNGIQHIPVDFFDSLIGLEILDLSENEMDKITFEVRPLRRLRSLNLRRNFIKTFSVNNMDSFDKVKNGQLKIDLSDNDILCSCATINFLKWMAKNKEMFIMFDTYTCSFVNATQTNLSDIHYLVKRLEKQCSSYVGVIVGTATAVTASLIIIIVGLVYRFRWRIRYFYYMAKRNYRGNRRQGEHSFENYTPLYKYAAFVSYSDEDRQIALHGMKTNVEDKLNGVKLCFHQRDFLPGRNIAENIANAIYESRKVVCFVSDSFLTSEWCMYEFNMALMENIHRQKGDEMLFLVLMKGFDTRKAPLPMLEFIRNNSYTEYPYDESYEPLFWSKVRETITC